MEQARNMEAWPAAKIAPPRPRALVSRPRLLQPLDVAAQAGHVALVVAPGGSGKSSLLADWAVRAPLPVAWYALDRTDRDTRRLVYGLSAAVEQALPGVAVSARTALDGGAPEAAALGLLLGALEGRPLALVLDDFQHLDDLPEAVALWDHLLRFRPPALALIILSRSVPLLGFAALAAMDELVGLGHVDLQFDAEEAAQLLAAHGLDPQPAEQIAARSGGWAAGVLLLSRAAPGGVRFLRARVDALMEHLGAEILATLPPSVRAFLLESAVLGAVTPEVADAILGRHDSAALYADVAARGLFLDTGGELYRYHDLFADFLCTVLHRESPIKLRAIRRAACDYWLARDDAPRALELLAAGEDWETLASVLERERTALWTRGLWGTILTHVERLPSAHRTSQLLALSGHIRAERGEYVEALNLADQGMAAASTDAEWLGPAFLRTQALVQAGRYDEGIRGAQAALAVARRVGHTRAEARLLEMRGIALIRLGQFTQGHSNLMTALSMHQDAQNEPGEAMVCYNLATQLIDVGHTHDAEGYLTRASTLWRHSNTNQMQGDIHNSRALLYILSGTYEAARSEVESALSLARARGHPVLECAALASLADICLDMGNALEAERHAKVAAEMAARLDVGDALNAALRTRIGAALLRRDRSGARRLLDEARPLVITPVDAALLDLYEGILALRSRAYTRAVAALDAAARCLEQVSRPQHAARAYLLYAEAILATGSIHRAEPALNRMAELVLPLGCEGFLRPTARLARQVIAERHMPRRLRTETRQLLDRLALASGPTLAILEPAGVEAPDPPTLRLSPFGQGDISLNGRRLDHTALPPKAREMLFYAAHLGRPARRDELLEALWEGRARAAQSLWDASRHLRRVLGEQWWRPSGGMYALYLPVHDAGRQFHDDARMALGAGAEIDRLAAAERALDVIGQGGYLEWCDSLWATAERRHVTDLASAVAVTLAGLYDHLGRPADALAACRRAIAFDPLDEAPRLALLRHLAATGDVSAALREYGAYQELLREELAVTPSAELQALAKGLGRHDNGG